MTTLTKVVRRVIEDPDKRAARIRRSDALRPRIEAVIQGIIEEEGWPQSLRPKAIEQFADHAVRVCLEARLPKVWAGDTFAIRRRGAVSSLLVLLRERAQFRTRKGRLVDAEGNLDWVLDCWEVALDAWDGPRQMRLL